jgi:hypothetical protein
MPSIVIRFVAEKRWYSPLIRWFSHGAYSHVDVVGPDDKVYGARPIGGVAARDPNYMSFSVVKDVPVEVTQPQLDRAWSFMKDQLGKKYDFSTLLAFALNRNWREGNHWACSELATAMLEQANVFKHAPSSPTNRITPCDLALMLSIIA